MLRDALGAVVAGLASGIMAALWLGRLMESMLVKVSSRDPVTMAAAAAFLLAVAATAAYVPARRATRIDPMIALRSE